MDTYTEEVWLPKSNHTYRHTHGRGVVAKCQPHLFLPLEKNRIVRKRENSIGFKNTEAIYYAH